jgi:hypothetical protein
MSLPGLPASRRAVRGGTGRPPEYCDDPSHNRAAAWRARQKLIDTCTLLIPALWMLHASGPARLLGR